MNRKELELRKKCIKLDVWFDNDKRESFRIDTITRKNIVSVLHDHNFEGVLSIVVDTGMWKINLDRVLMINVVE